MAGRARSFTAHKDDRHNIFCSDVFKHQPCRAHTVVRIGATGGRTGPRARHTRGCVRASARLKRGSRATARAIFSEYLGQLVGEVHHLRIHVHVCVRRRVDAKVCQQADRKGHRKQWVKMSFLARTDVLAHVHGLHLGDGAILKRADHLVVALAHALGRELVRAIRAEHGGRRTCQVHTRSGDGRT